MWDSALPLTVLYLNLFSLATKKDAFVYSYLKIFNEGVTRSWSINFVCDFNDWELE